MPNWCMNNLTLTHSDKAMLDKFVDAYNSGGVCEKFIPMPEGEDWYSWNISNWGTKWDFGKEEYYDPISIVDLEPHGDEVKNGVCISFNTAWSPPIGLYNKLIDLGYDVHASYFEPGMSFCGVYHNGHDNYIEYQEKGMIPVAIWNDFGLEDFFSDEMMPDGA